MDIKVIHDTESERFIANIKGDEAYAAYTLKDNIIKVYSTFTPSHLRGRGIAKTIVENVFKYAKENNLKVNPICSYVKAFVERNDNYKDLLA